MAVAGASKMVLPIDPFAGQVSRLAEIAGIDLDECMYGEAD